MSTNPKGNLEQIVEHIETLAGVPVDETTPNYLDLTSLEDRLAYALEELSGVSHPADLDLEPSLRQTSSWDRITTAVNAYEGGGGSGGNTPKTVNLHVVNNQSGTVQQKTVSVNHYTVDDDGNIIYDITTVPPQDTGDTTIVIFPDLASVDTTGGCVLEVRQPSGYPTTVTCTSEKGVADVDYTSYTTRDNYNTIFVYMLYFTDSIVDDTLTLTCAQW